MNRWLRQTRVRLTLAYSGTFALVALVAAAAVWLALASVEFASVDESLATQARSVEASVAAAGGQGIPPAVAEGLRSGAASGADTTAFLFDSRGGLVDSTGLAGSASAVSPVAQRAAASGSAQLQTTDLDGVATRLRASPVHLLDGSTRVVVLARSVADTNQLVANTAVVLLAGMAVLIVAASVLGYGLSRTALRPVREIAATARGFSEADLHQRIQMDLPGDELGELAGVFNSMLDRLESSFDSLQRFTADAAHELRAPLALIRTEAEVTLARARSPEEYQASLRTILAEAERLGRLADQLLMLARAEAGAMAATMRPVDLAETVQETVRLWRGLAWERGIEVTGSAEPESIVRGEPDLLRRMLDNLVDNAVRHAPEGSQVVVTCGRVDRSLELAVQDQGPGVPGPARDSIFQRFTRVDAARGRDTGGAGLGLALCAAIARMHDGTIRLDNGSGPGARFVVRMPAARS